MKICTKCNLEKPIDQFPKRSSSTDGRANWCTKCFSAHSKKRYHDSKAERDRKKRNRLSIEDRAKEFLYKYLSENPCITCGESDILVLEFDHRDPSQKDHNVSEMMTHSVLRIKKEIAKCDVLCANCHRRKTVQQQGTWRGLSRNVAQ